jgi:hypothetical protein
VSFVVLQTGVVPPQAPGLVDVHPTHTPSGSLQTGSEPVHCASLEQPVVQVSETVSQMPVGAWQVVLLTHWTQRFVVASHTGVDPVQAA